MKNTNKKRLVILRGVSGSGKSSLTSTIIAKDGLESNDVAWISTDDIWMTHTYHSEGLGRFEPYLKLEGHYLFDGDNLGAAHRITQAKCRIAMEKEIPNVFIDNTNTTWKEIKPYVEMALAHNYDIEVVEPETEWRFNAEECYKRNSHGVPKEVIQRMIDRWQTTEHILEQVKLLKEKQ